MKWWGGGQYEGNEWKLLNKGKNGGSEWWKEE